VPSLLATTVLREFRQRGQLIVCNCPAAQTANDAIRFFAVSRASEEPGVVRSKVPALLHEARENRADPGEAERVTLHALENAQNALALLTPIVTIIVTIAAESFGYAALELFDNCSRRRARGRQAGHDVRVIQRRCDARA